MGHTFSAPKLDSRTVDSCGCGRRRRLRVLDDVVDDDDDDAFFVRSVEYLTRRSTSVWGRFDDQFRP
jgi:hypothetical protein